MHQVRPSLQRKESVIIQNDTPPNVPRRSRRAARNEHLSEADKAWINGMLEECETKPEPLDEGDEEWLGEVRDAIHAREMELKGERSPSLVDFVPGQKELHSSHSRHHRHHRDARSEWGKSHGQKNSSVGVNSVSLFPIERTRSAGLDAIKNELANQELSQLSGLSRGSDIERAAAITESYLAHSRDRRTPALRPLLKDPLAERLELSHLSIDPVGAASLGAVCPQLQHLQALLLAGNRLADRGTAALVEGLRQLPNLTQLDLSSNLIRKRGATAVSTLLALPSLSTLLVAQNGMGDEACAALCRGLQAASCRIARLDVAGNAAARHTARQLAYAVADSRCSTLQELDVSWNAMRGAAARALAKALSSNTTLVAFLAGWNGFGEADTCAPYGAPGARPGTGEGAEGRGEKGGVVVQAGGAGGVGGAGPELRFFAAWLEKTSALDRLDLSHNRISTEGAAVLAGGLAKCCCVQTLTLSGNPILQSGSRVIWNAASRSGDQHGLRRVIEMAECGICARDLSTFDPMEPAGAYSLDLSLAYGQTVLRSLMRLCVLNHGSFADVKLGEQPYQLHFGSTIPEDEWVIPTDGALNFRFHSLLRRHAGTSTSGMPTELADAVLPFLAAATTDAEQKTMLHAVLAERKFKSDAIIELIQKNFKKSDSKVNLVVSAYHKVTDEHGCAALLAALDEEELDDALSALGQQSILYAPNNPTGHYRLDLAQATEREIGLRLCEVKNAQLVRDHFTASAGPQSLAVREQELDRVWRNVTISGRVHKYQSDAALPRVGILELDLVSQVRPPPGASAMDSDQFAALLAELDAAALADLPEEPEPNEPWSTRKRRLRWRPAGNVQLDHWLNPGQWRREMSGAWAAATRNAINEQLEANKDPEQAARAALEEREVAVLRRWSNAHCFSCAQVRELLGRLQGAATRAEGFVVAFRRTVDWHGLPRLLFELPFDVGERVGRRLGSANLFDPVAAVNYYELSLAQAEERWLLSQLIALANTERGISLVDTALNGIAFRVPVAWTKQVPAEGLVTLYYCRDNATIERVKAEAEAQNPGSVPSDFSEAAGQEWIVPFKLRWIKRKMAIVYGDSPEEIFRSIDLNGGGTLDRQELIAGLEALNIFLHPAETTALLEALDKDNNGEIDCEEFVNFWRSGAGSPLFDPRDKAH